MESSRLKTWRDQIVETYASLQDLKAVKAAPPPGIASLSPAYFAMVMATGIVSIAADLFSLFWFARLLFYINIVAYLAENASRDVSYREIYDIVHGEGFMAGDGEVGFRTNVRAFVKRIRQKFREVDPVFSTINNYPGFGYRWRDGSEQ